MFGSNWSSDSRTRDRLRTVLNLAMMEERVVPAFLAAGPNNYNSTTLATGVSPSGVGAIDSVSVNPLNGDQVLIASPSGGIWRTDNFLSASPHWVPIADKLPSLAIGAVAGSPLNFNHIFAATAINKSAGGNKVVGLGGAQGDSQGLYRSLDGGSTWTQLAKASLGNRSVAAMVVSGSSSTLDFNGQLILVATDSGMLRSTNGGLTFTPINNGFTSASENITDVILDQSDQTGRSFYAGVAGDFGNGGGVYYTSNAGTTWVAARGFGMGATTAIDPSKAALNLSQITTAQSVKLSMYYETRGAQVAIVYASIIAGTGASFGKVAIPDSINMWTHTGFLAGFKIGSNVQWVDLGNPNVHPGRQGSLHNAILAAPFLPDQPPQNTGTVFISGDRLGNKGTLVRSDDTGALTNLEPANGTQQHADTRVMVGDFNGNLIAAGDGGIYVLSPLQNAGTRTWVSKIGDLQAAELYSAVWDPVSNVVVSGAQDNGSPFSNPIDPNDKSAAISYKDATGGDGGIAAVDSTSIPGSSIRYQGSQNLGGFQRIIYDASGTETGRTLIAQNLLTEAQFITPFELNAVDPKRIIVGGVTRFYESYNQGNNFATVSFLNLGTPQTMAYGGFKDGIGNLDSLWIGSIRGQFTPGNPGLYFRNSSSVSLGSFNKVAGLPSTFEISDVTIDPQDYTLAYVVSVDGQVAMVKINGDPNVAANVIGATVTMISGNLAPVIGQSTIARSNSSTVVAASPITASITVFDPSPAPGDSIILVGGIGGVYITKTTAGAGTVWSKLSPDTPTANAKDPIGGIPNVVVQDLRYNAEDDILVAGTYGRGTYILKGASSFLDKAKTSIALTVSAPAILTGQSVTFTATIATNVTPLPGPLTGTIVFMNGSTILAMVPIVNGVASFTTTSLPPGTYNVVATFATDAVYKGSTSNVVNLIVSNLAPSITTVTSNLNPSIVTQAVTLTATVTGFPGRATPTGTVTFSANGVPIVGGTVTLDANGVATFVTTRLPIGSTTITAIYSGAVDYLTSSASLVQVVSPIGGSNSPVGLFSAGSGVGEIPQVVVYNPDNSVRFTFQPYESGYLGGVRVAVGDVNGDGTDDIVTATGEGGGPHVTVWDGKSLTEIGSFYAYDKMFFGGLFIAVGDVNGDGRKDIITGVGPGGGPHVKVFDFASLNNANGGLIYSKYVYAPEVSTGISVAAGDVNGDGRIDIIVGAGPGGGPHVKAIDFLTGTELASYYAYNEAFRGGVVVAAGDLDGNGTADIITGTAATGTPHVTGWDVSTGLPNRLVSFFAYDQTFTYGVRVAAKDRTGTGIVDIITGNGPQSPSRARVFDNTGALKADLDPFASDVFGIFVG